MKILRSGGSAVTRELAGTNVVTHSTDATDSAMTSNSMLQWIHHVLCAPNADGEKLPSRRPCRSRIASSARRTFTRNFDSTWAVSSTSHFGQRTL